MFDGWYETVSKGLEPALDDAYGALPVEMRAQVEEIKAARPPDKPGFHQGPWVKRRKPVTPQGRAQ